MLVKIAEIYKSVQGEGLLTGTESVFVRASGCNLRCWYCDTPYTSWTPAGNDLSVNDIVQAATEWDLPHVVITGGEPMLFAELIPVCEKLKALGKHLTIETAGTLYLPLPCDLMSISPKFSSSAPAPDDHPSWYRRHQRTRHQPEVIRQLLEEYTYQLKFVIDSTADCDLVDDYLQEFPEIDQQHVYLMPQGVTQEELSEKSQWLEPICQQRGWHFCPRMQIQWFGLSQGT
jgi:7-carboxy-7-deazaguanine synthase